MATNYTGNVTPSLSNAPASSWTDDAAKRSHVGNTYLVTGSGGTAGNVYAFEEYAAPLVKNASGLPADIVTITDGGEDLPMTKAEVSLSPIQSLNGYDHPWAGGAGKNKYPNAIGAETFANNGGATHSNSDGTLVIVCDSSSANSGVYGGQSGAYHTAAVSLGYPCTISFEIWGTATGQAYLAWESAGKTYYDISATHQRISITATAQASSAYLNIYGRNYNGTIYVKDVQIEAGSTATAYAPYENLCPISGHTGATLYKTGENVWKFNASYQSASSGTLISNQAYVLNAGIYTLSMKGSIGAAMAVTFRDSGSNVIVTKTLYSASFVDGYCAVEITLTKQSAKLNIYSSGAYDISEIQLEVGSIAHAYEEPTATAYPVTFGQTVYGGTFDFVSGNGQSKMENVDLGTLSWGYTNNAFYATMPDYRFAPNVVSLSSAYLFDGTVQNGTEDMAYKPDFSYALYYNANYPNNRVIYVNNSNYTDAASFKTAMNGVQLVYELQDPIEIDLTPAQVQTLLGLNNVWASDGQISALTYQSNQFIPKYDWFETWNMPKITRNNGSVIVLPYPKEYTPEIHDVDAATTGRNAAGTMIRDRVAIKHKFNYVFPPLSQADATELLAATKDASFTLTTASPETGAKTNYRVYAGDKSLPVYWMPNHDTASWLYSSVSVNLIEM